MTNENLFKNTHVICGGKMIYEGILDGLETKVRCDKCGMEELIEIVTQ